MNKKINDNLLGKVIVFTWIVLLVFSMFGIVVKADTTQPIEPVGNQHFELRAATINNTEENGRQVIMELWGHDIDFKRI